MDTVQQYQKSFYEKSLAQYGNSALGMNWANRETQEARFQEILTCIGEDSNGSLLDVGCGSGALLAYLLKRNADMQYTGIDISDKMINVAKNSFPNNQFYVGNADCLKGEAYDFVVSSGIFNACGMVPQDVYFDYVEKTINSMWRLSKKGVVANFLIDRTTHRNNTLYYSSPESILELLYSLSRHVVLKSNYALYEFTCAVYTEEYINSSYKSDCYKKYFKKS